eukprot:455181_1
MSEAKKCQIANKTTGHSFEIDFGLMIETNVVNGWQRKVRMQPFDPKVKQHEVPQKSLSSQFAHPHVVNPNPLLQSESSPRSKPQNAPNNNSNNMKSGTKYKWQWYSESIGWKDYDAKLSNKIDDAYRENVARYAFKIRSNNTKYEIDFDRMKQCNLDTMKLRIIRRVPLAIAPSPSEHVSASPVHHSMDDILNEENERFVWEHYDEDDCLWHEYGDNVSLKIETVHHSNAAVARMKIHGIEYEIRLNEIPMNQYNLRTGKISPIRRMVKSKHVKRESNIRTSVDIPVMDPHAFHEKKPKYEWRYKQGFNVWKVYPNDINIQIEKAFRAEVDHFQFSINNQQYEIQFNFLRQVNLGTNDVNEIARIDHTAHAKRSQTMFSKSGPNPKMKVGHEPAKSFNPMEIEPVNRQKSGHNKRSATLDITQNKQNANVQAALGGGQDFEALVKQQQKAMKYFKVKHSKKNSSKQTESDSNEIHHEETNEYYPDEDIDRFRWMLRNDNGDWVYYPPSLSTQIEQAYQGGEDSINITKNDTVFEIRIEHKLECHFGTNKVRPIKRVNINAKYDPTYDAQYNEINFKPKPKPKPKPDLDIEFDALTNKLDDFGDAISNDESEDKENEEFSDYDEHDEDEKDYEYREAQAHRNRTKTPQRPIDMRESTSYDEQESTPAAKQEPEAGTPADSEFALKDYGNDYNEYIQKFNNLNQG